MNKFFFVTGNFILFPFSLKLHFVVILFNKNKFRNIIFQNSCNCYVFFFFEKEREGGSVGRGREKAGSLPSVESNTEFYFITLRS